MCSWIFINTSGMNARGSSSVTGCHCICCWISWTRSKFFSHIIFASSSSTRKQKKTDALQTLLHCNSHSPISAQLICLPDFIHSLSTLVDISTTSWTDLVHSEQPWKWTIACRILNCVSYNVKNWQLENSLKGSHGNVDVLTTRQLQRRTQQLSYQTRRTKYVDKLSTVGSSSSSSLVTQQGKCSSCWLWSYGYSQCIIIQLSDLWLMCLYLIN